MTKCRHKKAYWVRHDGIEVSAVDPQAVRQVCLYCAEVIPFGRATGEAHQLPAHGRHHETPGAWAWDPSRPVAWQYPEYGIVVEPLKMTAAEEAVVAEEEAVAADTAAEEAVVVEAAAEEAMAADTAAEETVVVEAAAAAVAAAEEAVAADTAAEEAVAAEKEAVGGPASLLLAAAGAAGVEASLTAPLDRVEGTCFSQKVLTARKVLETSGTVTFHLGTGTWHDGPGWYYTVDACPDAGSCGAFDSRAIAEAHARTCGYALSSTVVEDLAAPEHNVNTLLPSQNGF